MGKSYTPKYRVELVVNNNAKTVQQFAWDNKRHGQVNGANLARFVERLEESYLPGGVNAHLTPINYISGGIVEQASGAVLAFYYKNTKEEA